MVEHKSERKFNEHSEFKEIWKDVSLRLILEDRSNGRYQFVASNLGFEVFLEKKEHLKKGVLK